MKYQTIRILVAASLAAAVMAVGPVSASEPQLSPRMEKAKDYIADEQWVRALEVLRAAAADMKEKHRDEALFWLAHSQHQTRDLRGAVETIKQLEREFPTSRWTKPAGSLRVELAQKLRNSDVLWFIANGEATPIVATTTPPRAVQGRATTVRPAEAPAGTSPSSVAIVTTPAPRPASGATVAGRPRSARPPAIWVSETTQAGDASQRLQALGSLMQTDAPRVIPMLRAIAMESANPREASRAIFLLAQSGRPDAHHAVLEVARTASESVSVAAVREFGRFGGKDVSRELLKVYESAKPRVKYQVVNSLGERAAATALMQIAQSETDAALRDVAIITLGQAGARQLLQRLYVNTTASAKRPIIRGLFNARAEEELIRIAEREKDEAVRREIHEYLRLLGTPKTKSYLERVKGDR